MKNVRVFLMIALVLLVPVAAAAQDRASRFSVHFGAGTMINGGGNTQSLSVGFWPAARIGFVVSAERIHLPTDVNYYANGYDATRGGTTTFVAGELRWLPFTASRVSPYVFAGAGRGTARLNVNEFFPDPVSNPAMLFFFGGGLQVPAGEHLSVFADVSMTGQLERDVPYLFVPARAGIAWRF